MSTFERPILSWMDVKADCIVRCLSLCTCSKGTKNWLGALLKFAKDAKMWLLHKQVFTERERATEREMRPFLNLFQTPQAITIKGVYFIKVCQLGYSHSPILCQNTNMEGVRVKDWESVEKVGETQNRNRGWRRVWFDTVHLCGSHSRFQSKPIAD